MLELILRGVGLAFSAAVSPGPFQAYAINQALALGWRKTIVVSLVPIITDAPLIPVVVLVLGAIPPGFIRLLQIAGGGFLLWIAWGAWQGWRAGARIGGSGSSPTVNVSRLQILRRGIMIALLSPGPYLFWSTVNGPILVRALESSAWHGLAFLAGFYGAFAGCLALTVLIFDRLRSLDSRVTRLILLLTVIILVGFGVTLIAQGLGG